MSCKDESSSAETAATDTSSGGNDADWLGRVSERLAVVYLASGDDDSDGPLSRKRLISRTHQAKSLQTAKCKPPSAGWLNDLPLGRQTAHFEHLFRGFFADRSRRAGGDQQELGESTSMQKVWINSLSHCADLETIDA